MSDGTPGSVTAPARLGVFLSYSHDSDAHREMVLSLAERLRRDGVDAQVDQYVNGTPEQGWPRWMLDRLDEAAFVLVVCTETYYRRFRGHEMPGRGKGADWEGALITQEIYAARSRTVKFVPVLLTAGQEGFVPEPLRGHTHYELTSEEGYQGLYRFLLGRAAAAPSSLGDLRPVALRAAKPLTFDAELASRNSTMTGPRGMRPVLWLLLPTLILLPLVLISPFWHLPTRVRLELATTRLALTLGGSGRQEILNPAVPFSALVLEDCGAVTFIAETLEVADPAPHAPADWRVLPVSNPVRFSCRDPEAKLTLRNPDPAAAESGALDHIAAAPGSQVILEVSPSREPAVSLEIETPQSLHIAVGPALELTADFAMPEGIPVPFQITPLTWRARIPKGRLLDVTSSERGLVLIVTPARGRAEDVFPEKPELPLTSLELLEENLRSGDLASPLSGPATLSYPDYPDVPPVTIQPNEKLGLGGLERATLTHLSFDAGKSVLQVGFDGIAERPVSQAGEFVRDHRLTLFHTVRHRWRWALIAVAGAWLVSTSWTVFEVWKKLQE